MKPSTFIKRSIFFIPKKFSNLFISSNYKKVLSKIRTKKKLKIIFLCMECSKWGAQYLYKMMEKHKNFEPQVILVPPYTVHKGEDLTKLSLEDNLKFYKANNIKVELGYDIIKYQYIDLKQFKPDIVFYEQPYDLPPKYSLHKVSKNSLCMYFPYGYENLDFKNNYTDNFHKHLFAYFVECKENLERYEHYRKGNSKNCIITGHPKLDYYITTQEKCFHNNLKIIYAPHHSLGKHSLRFGTFRDNGQFILNLAQKHREIDWVFKPHPKLKFELLDNKIMTQEQIDEYWKSWQELGTVHEYGNYLELFQTSEALITDSISFLVEYLPTQKPIIQLFNKMHHPYNLIGERISQILYKSTNNEELDTLFNEVIVNRNDYLKDERIKLIHNLFDFRQSASEKIINYLEKVTGIQNGTKEITDGCRTC